MNIVIKLPVIIIMFTVNGCSHQGAPVEIKEREDKTKKTECIQMPATKDGSDLSDFLRADSVPDIFTYRENK